MVLTRRNPFAPVRAAAALMLAVMLATGLAAPRQAHALPDSFADLAERLSPAVVNISTAQRVERPGGLPPLPEGSPLDDLLRDFMERDGQPEPRTERSLGSGFVISGDGYIVTNNHVIEAADEITVIFTDGTELEATLIGTDSKTDIALLKVEPEEPLAFVSFGDSETARVGDWVLAIGNPFGLGGSVSAGIISARNRRIDAGPYDDFIQTDAAINRGNSGGPLFNMAGEVIGVNTAIISPSGGSIGIGFSVPSNIVANVVSQLREFGMTRRGWLGVRIQTVDSEMAEALGMEKPMGALVAEVTEGGPAEAGGLEVGDVIISFDGKDVSAMQDLPRMVAETPVDKVVRVTVFREGKTLTLKVTLGLLDEGGPEPIPANALPDAAPEEMVLDEIGLTLSDLSPAARGQLDLGRDVTGVLVVDVLAGSPAAEKGLQRGDVIVEVGQTPVATPKDVRDQIETARDAGRRSLLFLVLSAGDLRFVPIPVL